MASQEPVLSVENLAIKAGDTSLVKNISFQIQPGEIFALVGESGSGKSLTSLAIMRLLPEALDITGGQIVLNEESLFLLPEVKMQRVRGQQVAMIFQEPMTSLNPVMKVGDQVAEALKVHLKMNRQAARKR